MIPTCLLGNRRGKGEMTSQVMENLGPRPQCLPATGEGPGGNESKGALIIDSSTVVLVR